MTSGSMRLAAAVIAGLTFCGPAFAQLAPFGSQRITLVVPAAAGGATDIIARIASVHLQKALNQSVIVENRAGANGNIGAVSVVRAPPDGHTLLIATTNNMATNQFTMANPGYDPSTDLTPVAFVVDAPELVAIPMSFPAKDMKEFIAALKAKPGAYNYGTPGAGSVPHLSVERLLRATGTKMAHVPFRGSAAAMAEVANNNIQMTMATLASIDPFRQAGTSRILAVAGKPRLKGAPEVPTLEEAGYPDLEMSGWWGVLGPKGMSPETVRTLNRHLQDAFRQPENVAILERLGLVAYAETPEWFTTLIQKEIKVWKAVIEDLGIKPE